MDKKAFIAAIGAGPVSFDTNDTIETRTVHGAWISEVLADKVQKCAIERAHIVGDIRTESSDISTSIQLTSCSLDSFDGGGSNFKSLVALRDCKASGFISLTGSSLTQGVVLTGTSVAESVSIALAEVRLQFNASSLSCPVLQMNGATIRGDCC